MRCLISFLIAASVCAVAVADDAVLAVEGRSIYRTSMSTSGAAIQATVQSDVPLPPGASACVNCHRRSGYGVSEGGSRSLNLTAAALFNPSNKPPMRPAYNDETLLRAIVAGIAPDGRALDATMPRYHLNADEGSALLAYLHTLGAALPDGVSESTLTLATVLSEETSGTDREALVAVLQRFVERKNSETRNDTKRAVVSSQHYYGRNRQRAHRTWELDIWTLDGDESTWRRQLEDHYSSNPPFALLSGSTGPNWLPVHEFCEDREIPCILPLGTPPVNADDDFYSLYFSAADLLEAEITAQHIIESGIGPEQKVLVVRNDNDQSRIDLDVLRKRFGPDNSTVISSITVSSRRSLSARKWRSILSEEKPDILIVWLPAKQLAPITDRGFATDLLPSRIYTMDTHTDWRATDSTADTDLSRLRHVYPYSLPPQSSAQFPREYLWLKQNELQDLDPVAASKVLFACRALGVGMADIQTNFSREYLLESLEHALDGTQLTSVFPRTSLGPDQRLLSRGAFVTQLIDADGIRFSNAIWVQR